MNTAVTSGLVAGNSMNCGSRAAGHASIGTVAGAASVPKLLMIIAARWRQKRQLLREGPLLSKPQLERGQPYEMCGLINRVADNWRPLFAIADLVGSDWPDRVRKAARSLAPKDSDSIKTMLLADIKAAFDCREGEWADRMFSEMVTEALSGMEGRPWAEFGKSRKPITKNQL